MPADIIFSKAAVVGGYAVGAVLAVIAAAVISLGSAARDVPAALEEHDAATKAQWAQQTRSDSLVLGELRKQSCILVSETRAEKRDCLRRQ